MANGKRQLSFKLVLHRTAKKKKKKDLTTSNHLRTELHSISFLICLFERPAYKIKAVQCISSQITQIRGPESISKNNRIALCISSQICPIAGPESISE
jgi:hypothetical protein